MSGSLERFDERARRAFARHGRTIVRRGELLRHPVYTRVLHWTVALTFVLALLSGFAVYSAWLFHWLTPIFGGGPMTRFLHPWFGVAFIIAFAFQFVNWLRPMRWTGADSRWMRRLKAYVTNEDKGEPAETGFFNAGQKAYFWAIFISGIFLLITGLVMWFDHIIGRWIVAVSYVVHDLAALVMLAGFMIHVYQSTASEPGTFGSMIEGTVTDDWARTHHPAWYRDATGTDQPEHHETEVR